MVLGLTVAEMSTRNISWGKYSRCVGLTLPLSCADCLEIWDPWPPGILRASTRITELEEVFPVIKV
jgi:hypothetical protein